jgi:hypothetical protein
MNVRLVAAGLLLAAMTAGSSVRAHEPLWGETPQTFSFGVIHPEYRYGFAREASLFRGSQRIDDPLQQRLHRQENLLSLQYAPKTTLNIRLEAPFATVTTEQTEDGQTRRSSVSGPGDFVLSAKNRFDVRFGPNWKAMHAATVGLQLPTGAHDGRDVDGTLLPPSKQPGTGNWGVMLGYSYAFERLQDTVWASAMYMRDLTGSNRRGDSLMLDAAYGYWIHRANRPQDFGAVLAGGLHAEGKGRDRIAVPTGEDTGGRMVGVQASLIATKGQGQARVGVLLPVYQHYNGTQLGLTGIQVRAGVEALF